MNPYLVVAASALAVDSICSALLNMMLRARAEKQGHKYDVLGLDGDVYSQILVNHRGKILVPFPTGITLAPYGELFTRAQAANAPEKRDNILLIQLRDYPDYVCDARLGAPAASPQFAHGSFVCDHNKWESSRVHSSSILESAVMYVAQRLFW